MNRVSVVRDLKNQKQREWKQKEASGIDTKPEKKYYAQDELKKMFNQQQGVSKKEMSQIILTKDLRNF